MDGEGEDDDDDEEASTLLLEDDDEGEATAAEGDWKVEKKERNMHVLRDDNSRHNEWEWGMGGTLSFN